MKTNISWAELHAPLFLNGTNLGNKLDPSKRGELSMQYCEDKKHLYVTYKGKSARIPETSVLSMVEASGKPAPKEKKPAPVKAIEAQVETPQSHVFSDGPGLTGQEGFGKSGKVKL